MTDLAPTAPYGDRLSRLLSHLTTAALLCGTGQWTHAALIRQGYRVSLCVREDRRRIIAISREDRPEKGNIPAWDRHHATLGLIRIHMNILLWPEITPQMAPGVGTVNWYEEPTSVSV